MLKKILFIILTLFFLLNADSKENNNYLKQIKDNIDLFFTVYRQLNLNYVDTLDNQEFIKTGIKAMLSSLDPYTTLLEKKDQKHFKELSQGHYSGIGIYVGTSGSDKRLTVISPLDNSPASRAGLEPGDKIMMIDSISTDDLNHENISDYLRGPDGSKVTLTIKRLGQAKLLKFDLEREKIPSISVPFHNIIDKNICYIRVSEFSVNTVDSVKEIISSYQQLSLKGVILDLRNNPGGLLSAAVDMVSLFVPENSLVVTTKGKFDKELRRYYTLNAPLFENLQLAVLIDKGSASASEITAGALQDYDRAVIIGQESFGKGLVQQIFNVAQNTSLKITIAKYFTPSGRLIQKRENWGDNLNIKFSAKDTLSFKTSTGRSVKSGSGITPDITIEADKKTTVINHLLKEKAFQNFCYDYFEKGNKLELDFEKYSTDLILPGFEIYLKEKLNTDTILLGYSELDSLSSYFSRENLLCSETKKLISSLKEKLKPSVSSILKHNEKEIRKYLDIEFKTKFQGYKAKYPVIIKNDKVINKALDLLKNNKEYSSILNTDQNNRSQ